MPVKMSDLEDAVNFTSDEVVVYLDTESGQTYLDSDMVDLEEELPADLYENDKYIELPDKRDLDLGKRLVFRFIGSERPDDFEKVEAFFYKRGAYSKYKDYLAHEGLLDSWYEFEQAAVREALIEWCEENDIELSASD